MSELGFARPGGVVVEWAERLSRLREGIAQGGGAWQPIYLVIASHNSLDCIPFFDNTLEICVQGANAGSGKRWKSWSLYFSHIYLMVFTHKHLGVGMEIIYSLQCPLTLDYYYSRMWIWSRPCLSAFQPPNPFFFSLPYDTVNTSHPSWNAFHRVSQVNILF